MHDRCVRHLRMRFDFVRMNGHGAKESDCDGNQDAHGATPDESAVLGRGRRMWVQTGSIVLFPEVFVRASAAAVPKPTERYAAYSTDHPWFLQMASTRSSSHPNPSVEQSHCCHARSARTDARNRL